MTGLDSPPAMKARIWEITKASNPDTLLHLSTFVDEVGNTRSRRATFRHILLDPGVFDALTPVVRQIPDPITFEYNTAVKFILEAVTDALSDSAFCSHVAHSGFVASVVNILRTWAMKIETSDETIDDFLQTEACGFIRFASLDALMRGYMVNSDCVLLLQKVAKIRPNTQCFGALATLARQSQEIKQQIRIGGPEDFFANLTEPAFRGFSSEEDPAGAMFFLSVWDLSELRNHMGEGSDFFSVVLEAHSNLYGPVAVFKDTILPMADLALDIASGVTYVLKRRFQWLTIVGGSMIFNTAVGVLVISDAGVAHQILHAATLGAYGIYFESRTSSVTGIKSGTLKTLKMLECVESSVSFVVGAYSILIAGYLDDYPAIQGSEAIIRWGSVGTSLVTIPAGVFEFSYDLIISSCKGKYASRVRRSGSCSMLRVYQGSEIWSHLTLVCFQIMTRPLGLVYLLGAQFLVIGALSCYSELPRLDRFLSVPLHMAFQLPPLADVTLLWRVAVLRLVTLVAAWVVIFTVAVRLPDESELLDHLKQPNCMALVAIAALGTIAHFFSFFHQLACGRWITSESEDDSEAQPLK